MSTFPERPVASGEVWGTSGQLLKTSGWLLNQRKTKGQQLKGKIVSALFHTFWHFPHIFILFQSFSEFFLQDFFLELRGFTTALVQRDKNGEEKRIKRKRPNHFAH